MATAVAPRLFKNFINGEWVESRSGKAYENRNPANTDELIGMFVSSTNEDVDAAVKAAKEAESAQHGVLGDILGVRTAAQKPAGQVKCGVEMRQHELLKAHPVLRIQHVRTFLRVTRTHL